MGPEFFGGIYDCEFCVVVLFGITLVFGKLYKKWCLLVLGLFFVG